MRAVIFTDVPSRTSMTLSRATIDAAQQRDVEVCGFVTANPAEMIRTTPARLRRRARRLVVAGTGGNTSLRTNDVSSLARRHGLPFLVADEGVNDAGFIERLHSELAPDVILSYFCVQIFKAPLLESVAQAVNYHDGLLPHYGGLAATSHSLYAGESRSGFTFHRMTTGIDDGPILAQGDVAVSPTATFRAVDDAKVHAAAALVPPVLDMILDNDPGRPQVGTGSYFNNAAATALTVIDDPSIVTAAEIHRRLRAFGSLSISIDGNTEPVNAVTSCAPDASLAFPTAEGSWLRPTRIAGLPTMLIATRRTLRSRVGV